MTIQRDDTGKFAIKDSLCWHCSRSEDGSCSWSDRFVPVEGWDAQKSKRKSEAYKESYNVRGCPQFARYSNSHMDDKGAEILCDSIIARAGKDYLELLQHEKKNIDKDVALQTKRSLYGRYDSRNKQPIKWGKTTSNTWWTLYRFEIFNDEILSLERFFRSDKGELFCVNIDPVYIMESIRREVGIRNGHV